MNYIIGHQVTCCTNDKGKMLQCNKISYLMVVPQPQNSTILY